MNVITWVGTVAGALIAVGTVVRWAIRRAIRLGTWVAAAVRLPAEVDHLAVAVTDLTTAVHVLADAVDPVVPAAAKRRPAQGSASVSPFHTNILESL